MIDLTFIASEVDTIINNHQKTYKDSVSIFNNDSKEKLVATIATLINDNKVSKEFEVEIHQSFLDAIDVKEKAVKIDEVDYIMNLLKAYEKEEIGGYLLYCNAALKTICKHESDDFNKLLR